LGFTSEAHWLRYARKHLAGMFPYLPQQSGYNKRLRAALGLVKRVIRLLARSSDFWLDDCWIADSTPVPCGMSRPTVARSEQARYGEPMLKKVRQLIESVNDTLKGQLNLEGHGGRSCAGVAVRVAQRILAMAAAIWRNNQTGAPVTRSLIAYDH